jgi:hypothetical protein
MLEDTTIDQIDVLVAKVVEQTEQEKTTSLVRA